MVPVLLQVSIWWKADVTCILKRSLQTVKGGEVQLNIKYATSVFVIIWSIKHNFSE
jgi:hypothetical protein